VSRRGGIDRPETEASQPPPLTVPLPPLLPLPPELMPLPVEGAGLGVDGALTTGRGAGAGITGLGAGAGAGAGAGTLCEGEPEPVETLGLVWGTTGALVDTATNGLGWTAGLTCTTGFAWARCTTRGFALTFSAGTGWAAFTLTTIGLAAITRVDCARPVLAVVPVLVVTPAANATPKATTSSPATSHSRRRRTPPAPRAPLSAPATPDDPIPSAEGFSLIAKPIPTLAPNYRIQLASGIIIRGRDRLRKAVLGGRSRSYAAFGGVWTRLTGGGEPAGPPARLGSPPPVIHAQPLANQRHTYETDHLGLPYAVRRNPAHSVVSRRSGRGVALRLIRHFVGEMVVGRRATAATARGSAVGALVVLCTILGGWLQVSPAAAAGRATTVTVKLAPASIVANGTSKTTATVTVTDASKAPVSGDTIAFSAAPGGLTFSAVTNHGNGTYTATITGSTAVASVTITATDSSVMPNVLGQAELAQTAPAPPPPLPAKNVSVGLSPASILANGSSTSTATATVTNANGGRVSNDTIVFSTNDGGNAVSATTNRGNGIYAATIRSSGTAHGVTVTATDRSANISGKATLTQTAPAPPPPLPAKNVSVGLSPASIVANGSSTTTATAAVTNANGAPVSNDTIVFSTNDGGNAVSAATNRGSGIYTATITSSGTAHAVTVTATDRSANISGKATLTQTTRPPSAGTPTTTKLSSVPADPVTNQQVTLIATVASSTAVPATGTISFVNGATPISGCANEPVTTQAPIVTCVTTFSALTSPELVTAAFVPSAGSGLAGSTSATDSLVVGRDSTGTTLGVPNGGIVKIGADITYSATITSAHGGAFETGSVAFEDAGTPIPACAAQPLAGGTATCKVSYAATGTHAITAVYLGDANFSGSASSPARAVGVVKGSAKVLGIIGSTMQWTFFYTPSYTKVLALAVNSAPIGATVILQCTGGGCPFAKRSMPVRKPKPCKRTSKHRCPQKRSVTIHLMPRFHNHHLRVGARITVRVVRSHWIGKYYAFVMRARQAPKVQVECLAPGSSHPGVGC